MVSGWRRVSPYTDAATAGVAAALPYLAEQELDRRLLNARSDDLHLLGGMLSPDPRFWRPFGLALHLTAGAVFGIAFDRLIAPRLPGPYWLRGVMMAQVENASLWPLVVLMDRIHPAVKRGNLAPMNRPTYFAQAVLRHIALGATLGLLNERGRYRNRG